MKNRYQLPFRPSMGQHCILRTLAKSPAHIFTTQELLDNNPYYTYGGFYSGLCVLVSHGLIAKYDKHDVLFYIDSPRVNRPSKGRKPFCYQITENGQKTLEHMALKKLKTAPLNKLRNGA